LQQVWDMVRFNENEMKATDELIAPLVQVAGKMGCQIGKVSYEMRLIALNAQVQAARFGDSTGLEVLAESLRQIADGMGEGGNALGQDSRRIEQIATSLRACFAELRNQATNIRMECDHDIPASIDRLSRQEEKCIDLLIEAKSGVRALGSVREEMQLALTAAVPPLEDLAELALACGDLVEKNYRNNPEVLSFMENQLLDKECSRYTMASEKEVLLGVTGKSQSGSESATVVATEDETGDIELF
jgi:hypothetical protein